METWEMTPEEYFAHQENVSPKESDKNHLQEVLSAAQFGHRIPDRVLDCIDQFHRQLIIDMNPELYKDYVPPLSWSEKKILQDIVSMMRSMVDEELSLADIYYHFDKAEFSKHVGIASKLDSLADIIELDYLLRRNGLRDSAERRGVATPDSANTVAKPVLTR